jgi:hypothetical protein
MAYLLFGSALRNIHFPSLFEIGLSNLKSKVNFLFIFIFIFLNFLIYNEAFLFSFLFFKGFFRIFL